MTHHTKMDKCCKCNKKKMVLIECTCGMKYCLKHHTPSAHNCKRICVSKTLVTDKDYEATGNFKKIDKI